MNTADEHMDKPIRKAPEYDQHHQSVDGISYGFQLVNAEDAFVKGEKTELNEAQCWHYQEVDGVFRLRRD